MLNLLTSSTVSEQVAYAALRPLTGPGPLVGFYALLQEGSAMIKIALFRAT